MIKNNMDLNYNNYLLKKELSLQINQLLII